MRSFAVALIILCIMVTGMFLHASALTRAGEELDDIAESIQKTIENEDWEQLPGEVDRLCDKWDNMSVWLSCVIEHDEIDTIMISVAGIREYAGYREIPELMAELSSLRELINHIPVKEKPMPQNIL